MKIWPRTVIAALVALGVSAPVASAGGSHDEATAPASPSSAPMVSPGVASKISGTAATLTAGVNAGNGDDRVAGRPHLGRDHAHPTYYFQYGPTLAYGLTTPSAKVDGD